MQFDEFIAEIEAEAHAQGPEALAELEAFRVHFAQARTEAAFLRHVGTPERLIEPDA